LKIQASFLLRIEKKIVGLLGMEDAGNKTIQNWQIYTLFFTNFNEN
jgi:hypothetical protein